VTDIAVSVIVTSPVIIPGRETQYLKRPGLLPGMTAQSCKMFQVSRKSIQEKFSGKIVSRNNNIQES